MGRGKARFKLIERAAQTAPRKWINGPVCAQDYADVVTRCLDFAAQHIFTAGTTLAKAKERLPHGEWLRMFRDHEKPVARPIQFGARTAQMLMNIAAHPVLSSTNHGSRLPRSWRTLYELTKVPDAVLERGLADGEINPAMERRHIAPMLVKYRVVKPVTTVSDAPRVPAAEPEPETDPAWTLRDATCRLRDAVEDEVGRTPTPTDWRALAATLRALADEIDEMAGAQSEPEGLVEVSA